MRWPWGRPVPAAGPVVDDTAEATAARRRAEESLRAAKEQTGEIRREAGRSARYRRVNHFAELFAETFRGNR